MRTAIVLSALGVLIARDASARDCAWYGVPNPSIYNGNTGFDATYIAHMNDLGAASSRLGFRLDGHPSWDATLLAKYDAIVKLARENGIELLGLVHAESSYVNNSFTDPNGWNYDPYGDNWNNYAQTFLGITLMLMDRYGPYIKIWEIWNEENSVVYITAPIYARIMAEILNQGHDIINRWGLHVAIGGMYSETGYDAYGYISTLYGQTGRWDWLQAHYGRRYPWDYFGYHIYLDRGGATSVASQAARVADVHGMEQAWGDNSPLLVTEYGWTTDPNNIENQAWVTEAVQGSNIDAALTAYEASPVVAREYVFREDEWAGYGVFRGDWSAKPAAGVYASHSHGCTRAPARPVIPTSCSGSNDPCIITVTPGQRVDYSLTFYNDDLMPWPASATVLATESGAPSALANASWSTSQVVAAAPTATEGGLAATFTVPIQMTTPGTYTEHFQVTINEVHAGVPAGIEVIVKSPSSGEPSPDGGTPPPLPQDGGCGCHVSGALRADGPSALLALSVIGFRRRRRRR